MSIETPAVGLYATCEARLRALYQIPTPPGKAAVLELRLGDEGRVIDDAWPAEELGIWFSTRKREHVRRG